MKKITTALLALLTCSTAYASDSKLTYPIVDTGVTSFYSNSKTIAKPDKGDDFYPQDAHFQANFPSYVDNGDGTITDKVTGLMWQKEMNKKMTYDEAVAYANSAKIAGYDDWRIPTIKELYSLIIFTGTLGKNNSRQKFFIDDKYFIQPLGDTSKGEREIDAQTWSSTKYVSKTMRNNETIFGVNFIDGRIKGYPQAKANKEVNKMYFRLVRGNTEYGKNKFVDNGDGTITDLATGLMWQKDDSKKGMTWDNAIKYADELELAGHDDWILPDVKQLQSIVDYSRSPKTTNSAAINPMFNTSAIKDMDDNKNYPYFWSSTTHLDGKIPEASAAYVAFGDAQGFMHNKLLDVHGAGAQRSDPKTGNTKDYPAAHGPQGDIRTVYNYVRAVRYVK